MTAQPEPLLKTVDLKQELISREGSLVILNGIDMEIYAGQSIAIVGVSGSGKSTLLGLLAGLDTPSSGSVVINKQNLSTMDEEARALLRGSMVGFVFQNFQLLPSLTALENVMLPLEVKGHLDPLQASLVWLGRVGLKGRDHHYPHQLSGGEQQRVAVARAFASDAPILFADEPTGNLDAVTGATVADLLFELNQAQGTTLILVTHDESLADRCQRKFRMTAGELVEVMA